MENVSDDGRFASETWCSLEIISHPVDVGLLGCFFIEGVKIRLLQ